MILRDRFVAVDRKNLLQMPTGGQRKLAIVGVTALIPPKVIRKQWYVSSRDLGNVRKAFLLQSL